MKPSLQLKIGQSLTMTPQLQQAIRLLQLSTLELQSEVQQTLEENPMLELDENEPTAETPTEREEANSETATNDVANVGDDPHIDMDNKQDLPEDLPVDSDWDDIYDVAPVSTKTADTSDGGDNYLENHSVSSDNLVDHLLWQVKNRPISETDLIIAIAIIDAINDDGYLTESIDDIYNDLKDELDIEQDEVEAVLHMIQHLDPIGVGARDLSECLMIQLNQYDKDTDGLEEAKLLVSDYLNLLGTHDYARLLRKTHLSEERLLSIISFIQTLNPKPGSIIASDTTHYVVPDIFVRKTGDQWHVSLNAEAAPKLRINQMYAGYIQNTSRNKDMTYMRNSLQEARWFLKSLQSRSDTLLRVGNAIVQRQRLFLDYGDEGMKPMVLRDIAEELEMHESTISRVTTHKYMHTPRGVFEFKFFFSSHVSTQSGGECSATAIRSMVKKLIDNENPVKPMSDNKITAFLVKEGINVARRTVAKYRESMSIPPSNERKRLA